jgi:MOSC domain-containing protein YiiM
MSGGKLIAIAWKQHSHGKMIESNKAFVGLDTGVADDFRGKPGNRQVTVLAREAFEAACKELDVNPDWKLRRANLLVEGIDLENTNGRKLHIGQVVLEITGETRPCDRMDEQLNGLKNALQTQWRGGVTCKVLAEGEIVAGDEARMI